MILCRCIVLAGFRVLTTWRRLMARRAGSRWHTGAWADLIGACHLRGVLRFAHHRISAALFWRLGVTQLLPRAVLFCRGRRLTTVLTCHSYAALEVPPSGHSSGWDMLTGFSAAAVLWPSDTLIASLTDQPSSSINVGGLRRWLSIPGGGNGGAAPSSIGSRLARRPELAAAGA